MVIPFIHKFEFNEHWVSNNQKASFFQIKTKSFLLPNFYYDPLSQSQVSSEGCWCGVRCTLLVQGALSSLYKPSESDLNWILWRSIKEYGTITTLTHIILKSNRLVSRRPNQKSDRSRWELIVYTDKHEFKLAPMQTWEKRRRHKQFSIVNIALVLTSPRKLWVAK